MDLGANDYREGAVSRLHEAHVLFDADQWVGSVYLAGRAVECILRSLLWRQSRQQHIGHSLPRTLDDVRRAGFLREDEYDDFDERVNELAIVWNNDLRYAGPNSFERLLKRMGKDRRVGKVKIRGSASKANAKRVLEIVESIIQRAEPVCR